MGAALPVGDPVPADGSLPGARIDSRTPFSAYIHVPFCRVRCGYCDFNTYTATELRGARQGDYAQTLAGEVALAGRVLADLGPSREASTVFFGGGTPTLLPPGDLAHMLDAVRGEFGIAADAEVTVEANPDTVDDTVVERLVDAGVTRLSIGMQSAVPDVLAVLDRMHDPANVTTAVAAARRGGLQVSVDLIYGSPGETLDQWQRTVDAAIALEPDHLSAYALIVESGTKLERQIRRGEYPAPDDDVHAAMYEWADAALAAAGFAWYEVSNWARSEMLRSRHNQAYWRGHDWWGFGPGAHSHIGGVRFWNVRHPAAYAQRLARGLSPAAGQEIPDAAARTLERVLLATRTSDGLPIAELDATQRRDLAGLIADGLIDGPVAIAGRVVPTLRGRLLADTIVRTLVA
ncbi:radical SAM family heme chaperone HemW [Microbacterium sediminicola]|uniref:Heme chaperone HemW n=1 Tax=Microbacterium sediminicola TaxID=415210 RepID=A0ABN2HS17_9MICO